YIVDGKASISTGAGEAELAKAEEAFAAYIADRHAPPGGATSPKALLVDEVMSIYLREHAEGSRSKNWIAHMAGPILEWWGGKTLADIDKESCGKYVKWRAAQPIKQQRKGTKPKANRRVSESTARHELSVLVAALNHFHRSKRGPLDAMPVVEL